MEQLCKDEYVRSDIYVLTADIQNHWPDRRHKHDLTKAEVWEKGTRFERQIWRRVYRKDLQIPYETIERWTVPRKSHQQLKPVQVEHLLIDQGHKGQWDDSRDGQLLARGITDLEHAKAVLLDRAIEQEILTEVQIKSLIDLCDEEED